MGMPKGQSGNPAGRPKGTPNKVNAELKDMILGALTKAGGEDYLLEQARENPGPFMALVGKILPKDINATVNINAALAERIKEARERTAR